MTSVKSNDIESLVQLSRRQLWFAFSFVAVLGVVAAALIVSPGSRVAAASGKFFTFLPIFIAIAASRLRRSAPKGAVSSAAMQSIRDDELRQASLARAYRNGFVALLLAQPVLAVGVSVLSVANPVALMACVGAMAGALVFLGSLLYYDR